MYHCVKFNPDAVYQLAETDLYEKRILSIGFCPACNKPVAELTEYSFTGALNKTVASGINAQNMMISLKDSILRSTEAVCRTTKYKPYGWKYGINRCDKNGKVRQYACDFYGNKELIKKIG